VALGLVVLALSLGWALRHGLSGVQWAMESPEAQVKRALAQQTRAHLADVYGFRSGGTLELTRVRYADVVVAAGSDRAGVTAMMDGEGRVVWRDDVASISYLGRENFHMKPCSIALWCAEGDQFNRLRGILIALFRRADAEAAADLDAYGRLVSERYSDGGKDRRAVLARLAGDLRKGKKDQTRIRGWQIRVERDTAIAGEDRERKGPDGGVKPERARYALERDGDRWVIVGGL
jgi:hypothetical protein